MLNLSKSFILTQQKKGTDLGCVTFPVWSAFVY